MFAPSFINWGSNVMALISPRSGLCEAKSGVSLIHTIQGRAPIPNSPVSLLIVMRQALSSSTICPFSNCTYTG